MKRLAGKVGLIVLACLFSGALPVHSEEPTRPFYEYPGNYNEQVNELIGKFKNAFGYDLVGLGQAWSPREIELLHQAFSELPPSFYRLPGLKALYRLEYFMGDAKNIRPDEIPAATLPSFIMLHDSQEDSYKVMVANQDLRVEFFNNIFYEDSSVFKNIVHHEMAHAFDISRGFMSFSQEWRKISNFQALHLPALDAHPGSDFLFTFLNDAGVDGFAPVSRRHIPTYSRGNMQEDFANAVAGYIHYPYMRASHPARYQFLVEKVFGGKEYFPANKDRGFSTIILADFQEALNKNDYARVENIFTELSRGVYPKIEKEIVNRLAENMESDLLSEKDLKLGLASCYLSDPAALELRRDLVRKNRVPVKSFLKNEACARISPKNFEGNLATWPPAAMYFYIDNGNYYLQFLDPVLRVAHARGFHSRYLWRAFLDGGPKEPFVQGNFSVADGGNGAVKIDLAASSGGKISFPEGVPVLIELGTERMHNSNFKTILSKTGQIRFVVHPGFKYRPEGEIKVRAIYPMRASFKHQG